MEWDLGADSLESMAPSAAGFAGATFAGFNGVPAARWLAMLLATIVSSPAQIRHTAQRHVDVANQISGIKQNLRNAVDERASADHWTADDKTMFVQQKVVPYNSALDQAASIHKDGIAGSLNSVADTYKWAGYLSAALGAWMVAESILVDATAAIPGVDAATVAEANGSAIAARFTAKSALSGLGTLVNSAYRLFTSAKSVLALGAVGIGALEVPGFEGMKNVSSEPVMWPDQTQSPSGGPSGTTGPAA